MSDEKKTFAVHDRRHFAQDGSVRGAGDAVADDPAPAPSSDEPMATPPPENVDFASFVLSLGAQAGMMLGLDARGPDSEPAADLPGARSIISILEMLQDKTDGRRTPEEDRILEGILYDLRMTYVARAQAGKP